MPFMPLFHYEPDCPAVSFIVVFHFLNGLHAGSVPAFLYAQVADLPFGLSYTFFCLLSFCTQFMQLACKFLSRFVAGCLLLTEPLDVCRTVGFSLFKAGLFTRICSLLCSRDAL